MAFKAGYRTYYAITEDRISSISKTWNNKINEKQCSIYHQFIETKKVPKMT